MRPRLHLLLANGLFAVLLLGCASSLPREAEEYKLVCVEIKIAASPHPAPKEVYFDAYGFNAYAGSKNEDRSKDRKLASGKLRKEGVYWISLPNTELRYLRICVGGGQSDDGQWIETHDVDREKASVEDPIEVELSWHSYMEGIEIFQVPN